MYRRIMVKKLHFSSLFSLLLLLLVSISSCQKEIRDTLTQPVYNLNILFKPVVGTEVFEFGSSYKNSFGEAYTVRAFKYYISGIELVNDTYVETFSLKDDYFLVDFSKPASATLQLKTKPFIYNRIAFTIGVDSLHNVSGAQAGALDPGNGMFWTWNSGYIMAKLEGTSPASNQPNNLFEYHIGGFKGAENVLQKIYLDFPAGKHIDTENGSFSDVTISADINKWFLGTNQIRIAASPVITTPGAAAKRVAENYAAMFSVQEIINQ
ncbi:MAG TPA: MbnP family protein [Chitinophagaceae bacterium]|nr:MbnP family protein [Chitinophagaceae bacterium]